MNNGTFYIKKGNRLFYVEPLHNHAERNADWNNGLKKKDMPIGGAIHPNDSKISEEKFKNIITLGVGESPLEYIDRMCQND